MMNWEEKFAAIKAIGGMDTAITMRSPGDWHVTGTRIEIAHDGMLLSTTEHGRSPQEAVELRWKQLTELTGKQTHLVLNAYGDNRRHVRWNGYMWVDVAHLFPLPGPSCASSLGGDPESEAPPNV